MKITVNLPYPVKRPDGSEDWYAKRVEAEIAELPASHLPVALRVCALRPGQGSAHHVDIRSDGSRLLWPVADPQTGLPLSPSAAFRQGGRIPDRQYDLATLNLRTMVRLGREFPMTDQFEESAPGVSALDIARRVLAANAARLVVVDGYLWREGPEPVYVLRRDGGLTTLEVECFEPHRDRQSEAFASGEIFRGDERDHAVAALEAAGGLEAGGIVVADAAAFRVDVLSQHLRVLGRELVRSISDPEVHAAAMTYAQSEIFDLSDALETNPKIPETSARVAPAIRALVEKMRTVDLLRPERPSEHDLHRLDALLGRCEKALARHGGMTAHEHEPAPALAM